MDKKQPVRMCIACRTGKPKQELIRIVRDSEGRFSIDPTGKAKGRGAYICADAACAAKARKIFPKVMRCQMDEAFYESLLQSIDAHGK